MINQLSISLKTMINQERLLPVGLILTLFILSFIALTSGTMPIDFKQLLTLFHANSESTDVTQIVVLQWRLPRILVALFAGAALALSGAIFQSITRNPLGSPDIIGLNFGIYTGVLLVIIFLDDNYIYTTLGALSGGLITTLMIYLLTWKQGAQGMRLIIIGIAVSAILNAINHWLMINTTLAKAMSSAFWAAGSLNGMTWEKGLPMLIVISVILLLFRFLIMPMKILEMGSDIATALGLASARYRLILLLIGIMLTVAVTVTAGPIYFIALASPQIAKRLNRHGKVSLLVSSLVGANLLLLADIVAQHCFAPYHLPLGVITLSIGGLYLLWVLLQEVS